LNFSQFPRDLIFLEKRIIWSFMWHDQRVDVLSQV
jgi:hypothetical protein